MTSLAMAWMPKWPRMASYRLPVFTRSSCQAMSWPMAVLELSGRKTGLAFLELKQQSLRGKWNTSFAKKGR